MLPIGIPILLAALIFIILTLLIAEAPFVAEWYQHAKEAFHDRRAIYGLLILTLFGLIGIVCIFLILAFLF